MQPRSLHFLNVLVRPDKSEKVKKIPPPLVVTGGTLPVVQAALYASSPNVGRRLRSILSLFLHLVLLESVSLPRIWDAMPHTLDEPILQFFTLSVFRYPLHTF